MLRNLMFLLFILSASCFFLYAQEEPLKSFEGTVVYKRSDLDDTIRVKMYFKDTRARVDYYSESGKLRKYSMYNFSEDKLLIVNPRKKMYVEKSIKSEILPSGNEAEIRKTGNYKEILGFKVYQWIVKNTKRNTVVSYWVLPESYPNYKRMLKAMGRTRKIINYYTNIPDTHGYIFLEAEEFSLVRDRRMRFKALAISFEIPKDELFELPENYQLFE